jgi:DNA-binding NtrC family response regulator
LSTDDITVADLPEDPHESPFDDDAEESDHAAAPPPLPTGQHGGARATLREYRDAAERAYIVDVLKELEWNISRAAVTLGVERTNLHKKIRAYGIKRGEG